MNSGILAAAHSPQLIPGMGWAGCMGGVLRRIRGWNLCSALLLRAEHRLTRLPSFGGQQSNSNVKELRPRSAVAGPKAASRIASTTVYLNSYLVLAQEQSFALIAAVLFV